MLRRVIAIIEDYIRMDSPDKRRRGRWKLKTIYAEFSQWSRTMTLDDLSNPTCEFNFVNENRLMIPWQTHAPPSLPFCPNSWCSFTRLGHSRTLNCEVARSYCTMSYVPFKPKTCSEECHYSDTPMKHETEKSIDGA
jgi:hypothetical protein